MTVWDKWLITTLVISSWLLLTALMWRQHKCKRLASSRTLSVNSSSSGRQDNTDWPSILVAYASQTGTALAVATKCAQTLSELGQVRLLALNQVDQNVLQEVEKALFVVSTYGEGEPPDNAGRIGRQLLNGEVDQIKQLTYSVIALGDSSYPCFCAFGCQLHEALREAGASPLNAVTRLDKAEPDTLNELTLLKGWMEQSSEERAIKHITPIDTETRSWTLIRQICLNPGSPSSALYQVSLQHQSSPPVWNAGDVFELQLPHSQEKRLYSVASSPHEGELRLIVRQQQRPDGQHGLGSGLLTHQAQPGDLLNGSIRSVPMFHSPSVSRPLILIGAGSGLAGLRAQLAVRSNYNAAGKVWMIYGERDPEHDNVLGNEFQQWQQEGLIERLDQVYSRQSSKLRYVQHVMLEQQQRLKSWLSEEADIYVCGSLSGMGKAVHDTLTAILSQQHMDDLLGSGRYRRDIY